MFGFQPAGLPDVLGDATQLHQVLLNLCLNARDAMPDGGVLSLEAELATLTAAQPGEFSGARPGRFIIWSVSDTGSGIPPEVMERIFEPFFSTKGPDKGTGLGLSTALGIIRSHGGFIRVSSTPGQGSTFRVHLPATLGNAGGRGVEPAAPARFSGKGRLILVVDDDKLVRDMAATILESLGFATATATDGEDALLKSAEHGTRIQTVLTDLNMPRMDGMELVRALRQRLPGTGIIVSSGRLEERQAGELKRLGGVTVLHKPFRPKELIEALKVSLPAGP